MVMTLKIPDEVLRRLEAAAEKRGMTPEELAIDFVVERLPDRDRVDRARDALARFVGSASGDGSRFDIHEARRDLAGRRRAQGTRNL
jgi:hypothetical protein